MYAKNERNDTRTMQYVTFAPYQLIFNVSPFTKMKTIFMHPIQTVSGPAPPA